MQRIWTYISGHPVELLFIFGLVVILYLVARVMRLRPIPALVMSVLPVLAGLAFTQPWVLSLFRF